MEEKNYLMVKQLVVKIVYLVSLSNSEEDFETTQNRKFGSFFFNFSS